jgi:hypothetical protein
MGSIPEKANGAVKSEEVIDKRSGRKDKKKIVAKL